MIVGIILGVVSAYFGGFVDNFIMRVADMVLAMASFLIALVLLSILGRGLENVVFALGPVYYPYNFLYISYTWAN